MKSSRILAGHGSLRLAILGVTIGILSLSALGEDASRGFVGYMTDYSQSVSLVRTNSPVKLVSACVPLMESDLIILGADGRATVLLPCRAYVIGQEGTYHVRAQEIQRREGDRDAAVDPALGGRGDSAPSVATERIVMPPSELFASVKPSVMRAANRIDVLSPWGLTLSQTPRLVWTGDQTRDFRVQVIGSNKEPAAAAYAAVDVKGCVLDWAQTGWSPLVRGASYRIRIWGGDTLLTDDTHTFRIADAQQAADIEDRMHAIKETLPSGVGRDLAMASVLMNPENGYFSEARLIAVRLLQQEPDTPVYLHLMRHCYAGMGLAEGVAAIEGKLSRLD